MKDFPEKCPHCGKDVVPHQLGILPDIYEPNAKHYDLWVEVHECIHCHAPFFVVKEIDKAACVYGISKLYALLPLPKYIDYPEQVKELSEKAYEYYKQAMQAKAINLNKLVGGGLRTALEHLVYDYLTKLKGFTTNQLKDLDLCERINKIKGDKYKNVCAHIVRKFGNSSVHIIKQIDFDTEEVIELYKILIDIIETEITLINASKKLDNKT